VACADGILSEKRITDSFPPGVLLPLPALLPSSFTSSSEEQAAAPIVMRMAKAIAGIFCKKDKPRKAAAAMGADFNFLDFIRFCFMFDQLILCRTTSTFFTLQR
jgi:hypothetical protein